MRNLVIVRDKLSFLELANEPSPDIKLMIYDVYGNFYIVTAGGNVACFSPGTQQVIR
jgi:hypothetical protein